MVKNWTGFFAESPVLGPRSLSAYINDLADNISLQSKLFADDTSLQFVKGKRFFVWMCSEP